MTADSRSAGIVLIGLALLGASNESQAPRFPAVTHTVPLLELCQSVETDWECATRIESHQLLNVSGVKRSGARLGLPLATGGVRYLEDSRQDAPPDEVVRFRLIEFLRPLNAYFCYTALWEGADAVLVEKRTGRLFRLDAAPLLSPDSLRFATISAAAGHNANAVKIYRIAQPEPVLEWELEPTGWGPGVARWADPATFLFQTDGLADELAVPTDVPASITVHRRAQSWEQSPPGD